MKHYEATLWVEGSSSKLTELLNDRVKLGWKLISTQMQLTSTGNAKILVIMEREANLAPME